MSVTTELMDSNPKNDDSKLPTDLANGEQHADDWTDLLGSGALLKKVVDKGDESIRPDHGSVCTIDYKCYQLDGMQLIEQKNDFVLTIGDLDSIQGLDIAVNLMHLNEKAELKIQPRFGYGERGHEDNPKIASNTHLFYEVHLKQVRLVEDVESMTLTERQTKGNAKRIRGNWWFSRSDWTSAIQCYRKALEFLDEPNAGDMKFEADQPTVLGKEKNGLYRQLDDILDDRLKVLNNMAMAQIKLGSDDAALQSLETVLRCQPNNIKALFRKAKILSNRNEIEEAIELLKSASFFASTETNGDQSIALELKRLTKISVENRRSERDLAKKMFSSLGSKNHDDSGYQGDNYDDSACAKNTSFWSNSKMVCVGTSVVVALSSLCIYQYFFK